MKKLGPRVVTAVAAAALLLGCYLPAEGQFARRAPRVYRPGSYNNTRRLMNRRAAMRKVVKKRRKAARKRRHAARHGHAH
jgi:hypothetical protein